MSIIEQIEFFDENGQPFQISADEVDNVIHKGQGSSELVLKSGKVIYVPFSEKNQIAIIKLMTSKIG